MWAYMKHSVELTERSKGMKIRDFINLFGGNEEEQIELWNCDEREEITVGVEDLRTDSRWNELTEWR